MLPTLFFFIWAADLINNFIFHHFVCVCMYILLALMAINRAIKSIINANVYDNFFVHVAEGGFGMVYMRDGTIFFSLIILAVVMGAGA